MAEETYELRLEQEGFHIIPVGAEQLSLHPAVGGQLAVQLLPSSAVQAKGLKDLSPNLFLSTEEQKEEHLVIQYGDSWFQDLLGELSNLGGQILDYPVFCTDGIAWSNRVILASLAPYLSPHLDEDSCLVLPDCRLSQFLLFHNHLFSRSGLTSAEVSSVSRIAATLGLAPVTTQVTPNYHQEDKVDYQLAFSKQHREYLDKVLGHSDLASQVLRVADRPKRMIHPDFLSAVMRPCSPSSAAEPEYARTECAECGRTFEDVEMFKSHMETLHQTLDRPRERKYSCKFCDKNFHYQLNVKKHMFLVHPGCKDGQLGKENQENGQDMEVDEDEEGDMLEKKGKIQCPELEHFKCKICGEYNKSKRALVAHIQSHYGGGYKCEFPGCDSVFKENAKLTRHKLVHTGVKAFKCSYCHLAFSLRHNLKMHEKTHTRTDLLQCRFCGYQTIQRSNMRLHEATHGEFGDKMAATQGGRGKAGKAATRQHGKPRDSSPENSPVKAEATVRLKETEQETPDEIEKFIAEMEKDQEM